MSVVEAKLKFGGLSGKDELNLGRRHYTQEWLIRTDNPADGKVTVLNSPLVPQYGTFYKTTTEFDSYAYLRSRDAKLQSEDSSLIWIGTFEFDTIADSGTGQTILPPPQPFDVPAVIEWEGHEEKEPAYVAYAAVKFGSTQFPGPPDSTNDSVAFPIINTATDFIDPPVERSYGLPILKTTINQSDYNPILAAQYTNAVNSDTWNGWPPCTAMFKAPRARFINQRGFGYWEVQYEFWFNFRGFFAFRWDAGMREYWSQNDIDALANQAKRSGLKVGHNQVKNADGTYATEPVLLNGNGHRLIGAGIDALNTAFFESTILRFRVQPKLPFTPLGII